MGPKLQTSDSRDLVFNKMRFLELMLIFTFMVNLDHILEYEHEHTSLDFKLEEYGKHKKNELIKDVMAMANASVAGDRLIIIGMKPNADDRGIVGINTISDPATIQQVIIDNIEPEIHLDYMAHSYQGKKLGVIRIYDCESKPYLMKKDFQSDKNVLKRGEGFVRLGTTQTRLYRSILEQIYKERYEKRRFSGDLLVSFHKDQAVNELIVYPADVSQNDLPSFNQQAKIEKVIFQKEKELKQLQATGMPYDENHLSMASITINSMANLRGAWVDYEHRSLSTLRRNLKNVSKNYHDEDYYYLLEENSEKLTLYLKNIAPDNLQLAKVVLRIAKKDGLLLAKNLPRNPDARPPYINFNYPEVEESDEYYEIRKDLGDVQPQLSRKIFEVPLRICILPKLSGSIIPLVINFYAKNLAVPIEKELHITVNLNKG
jgi:hypothetical protein